MQTSPKEFLRTKLPLMIVAIVVAVIVIGCSANHETVATQSSTTYQTDGQLLQGLIKNLGEEVSVNFFQHD